MKILIIKTSSLGDIIQVFPSLDYLRLKFPNAQIDWVVENPFAELILAHPQVNKVFKIESKKWRKNFFNRETRSHLNDFCRTLKQTTYDLAFDLQGNLKSGAILFQANAKKKVGFGWKTAPEWPNTLFTNCKINPPANKNIREDYLALVQGYFKDDSSYIFRPVLLKLDPLQEQKLVSLFSNVLMPTIVCPSSAWPNKCLDSSLLVRILHQLDKGPYWFSWGNSEERTQAIQLSSQVSGSLVLERLPLPLLQHVMAKSKLVIAMDSLPLHLCGTTSTPSLSFFGPSSALKYRPLGNQHLAIQGQCPFGIIFEKRCPYLRTCKTGDCLRSCEEGKRISDAAILPCL